MKFKEGGPVPPSFSFRIIHALAATLSDRKQKPNERL
jgi:hypothetical protein